MCENRVVCEERERERERAMIINKANKHLTPQIIEHKPVKEISLVIKCIKIKNKKYHIVETFNRKMVERYTPNKQIHDLSSSWYRYRYFHKIWLG
jgi:hypothetical protein